jgi:hypothetical protein
MLPMTIPDDEPAQPPSTALGRIAPPATGTRGR